METLLKDSNQVQLQNQIDTMSTSEVKATLDATEVEIDEITDKTDDTTDERLARLLVLKRRLIVALSNRIDSLLYLIS